MKRYVFWVHALLWLFLPVVAFGGETVRTGVIRGAVTLGGKPAADAVVSVEDIPEEKFGSQISKVKSKKAVMDQQDMKFIPHVLAVLVGTTVDFSNNDKTFHNVFSTSEAKKFDLGLYSPGRRRGVTFDRAGVVRVLCHVHPHMEAYIVVKEHPYFTVTDKQGAYQLGAVPVGKYRLEVWHPEFGTTGSAFDIVRGGEVLAINIEFKKK